MYEERKIKMKIRLAAELQTDSIVDGEGIRAVIWTQGCPHNCYKCHNPFTHDFNDGALIDIEKIKEEISNLKGHSGLTFSGGDPMVQPEACYEIAKYAKSIGLNIWCYTGYTIEELVSLSVNKPEIMKFLSVIDILIDGRFIYALKSFDAKYRGSTNQRIIDVPLTLQKNEVVLAEKYYENYEEDVDILNHEKSYMFV
ncbi:MAG: anaerobic ribonucleoside-triphosphate reductase activating protein [Clostridium sp.]|nr:anaerobic ribonucleoside-triphosphate reductase activating protein [Clostridium sp.]MCM1444599.1 anaerobic ribonucleoside-triphosphate reductase activating protein [Candidatus Amulumruptor caecigallinarius]